MHFSGLLGRHMSAKSCGSGRSPAQSGPIGFHIVRFRGSTLPKCLVCPARMTSERLSNGFLVFSQRYLLFHELFRACLGVRAQRRHLMGGVFDRSSACLGVRLSFICVFEAHIDAVFAVQ